MQSRARRKYLLAAMAGLGLASHAQEKSPAWPARPLRLVVNYGAGGATDVATRLLAKALETRLGQSMVVENRPGAQGTLGPAYVARQAADGYTMAVVTSAAMVIAPHLVATPYGVDDFSFAGAFGRFRFGLSVAADAPWQNAQELLHAARQKPLFFGASGATQALAFFALNAQYGTQFEQVLFKSGVDAITALGSGQVQAAMENPSEILPQVDAGRVRLLASASPARWSERPDMPTLQEAGVDIQVDSRVGLALPLGTSAAIRTKLEAVMQQTVQDADFQKGMNALGMDAAWASGADYARMLREEHRTMRSKLKQAGMPVL